MEDAALIPLGIDFKPNADVNGITSLTHQNAVTVFWAINLFPALTFWMVPKPARNGENVFRIWDAGKIAAKMLLLNMTVVRSNHCLLSLAPSRGRDGTAGCFLVFVKQEKSNEADAHA